MAAVKFPDITVQLAGKDGNAFAIIGAVSGALRRAGHGEEAKQFFDEATSGDYDNVLRTACAWVTVA